MLVQLDDLAAEAGSGQGCRVPRSANEPRQLPGMGGGKQSRRRGLRPPSAQGAGADPTASGRRASQAARTSRKNIRPTSLTSGSCILPLACTPEQFTRLGLVTLVEKPRAMPSRFSSTRPGSRKWPSYQRCVEGAPPNHGNTAPDISRADFTWCMTAIDWGWEGCPPPSWS
jgi:hypothetical protein